VKYEFIDRYRSEFRVKKMCRVLEVSRSGYYAWSRHQVSVRQRENDGMREESSCPVDEAEWD
jgi:putative transposase